MAFPFPLRRVIPKARAGKVPFVTRRRRQKKAALVARGGLHRSMYSGWNQFAGFSLATSALITSNKRSSLPAMPTSVTYLPFTITVGVPEIL
jgi:hypothetical protein